jgi:DNA polymerase delta subunit 1
MLQVMSFPTEDELLLRWRDLVIETDPDIIIGYNIVNFDLPYLIDRAAALRIAKFPFWGRIRNRWGRRGAPCEGCPSLAPCLY